MKGDRSSKSTNATDASTTTAVDGSTGDGLAYNPTFVDRTLVKVFKGVNKIVRWDKLPRYIGAFNLLAFRIELRSKNLTDVYPSVEYQGTPATVPMKTTEWVKARNPHGEFNSLEEPLMGSACMRLGRNVPRRCTAPDVENLMSPNPRIVSERLLARQDGKFKPATILNLLAAAWIQFQVHDWFFHAFSDEQLEIPLPTGDTWPSGHMKIPRTQRDDPLDETDRKYPAYKNKYTAWWDGSQIYGNDEAEATILRGGCENGKLKLVEEHGQKIIPHDAQGNPIAGSAVNWWVGLELMHTLFVQEHNSICDMLHAKHPDFSSEQLFDTARLVNTALIAKIHTVEWTPAILHHPTIKVSLDANWWGLIGETITKAFGRISKTSEIISGIPGSGVENDNIPFSLTEEFVSVYRMHTLIPDNIAFFSLPSGAHESSPPISSLTFANSLSPFTGSNSVSIGSALYSFGINYPGAITHHNYGSYMRFLPLPPNSADGTGYRDMASVDVTRDRERGVPRYCEFRKLFHMPVPKSYMELTGGDVELSKQLREVYGPESKGGLDKVDLLVGCQTEPLPKGFGFSDTAFRVFILMASRRLKSDRFIAGEGWSPNYYTKEGIAWVQNNTFSDVLMRHYPELKPGLKGVKNAFAPWKKVGKAAAYKGVETNAPKKEKRKWREVLKEKWKHGL